MRMLLYLGLVLGLLMTFGCVKEGKAKHIVTVQVKQAAKNKPKVNLQEVEQAVQSVENLNLSDLDEAVPDENVELPNFTELENQ